jgi:hypothetical protein
MSINADPLLGGATRKAAAAGDEARGEEEEGKIVFIEDDVNVLSRVTYWWVNGLVVLGRSRALVDADLGVACRRDRVTADNRLHARLQSYAPGTLTGMLLLREAILLDKTDLLVGGLCALFGQMMMLVPPLCISELVKLIERCQATECGDYDSIFLGL